MTITLQQLYCQWAYFAKAYDPIAYAVVHRPSSTEQVQKILKLANKARLPLWTCSRGKNYGCVGLLNSPVVFSLTHVRRYGGAAPRVAGSVVLSLHRMNKIIDFNEEFGFIVVEPGVTFYDCYDYLRAKCPQYWMGCPALGWGSIVGNASHALSNEKMRFTDRESLFNRH